MGVNGFYWYWLCNIRGVGNNKIKRLLNIFSDPKSIYDASREVLEKVTELTGANLDAIETSKRDTDLYKQYMELPEKGIRFINYYDTEYPDRLKNIYDYPVCIFVKGKLPSDNIPTVSIVGARACSPYGKETAYSFANKYARMGIQVISGLAEGIDVSAHRGCLDGRGDTYAVLGCGVDVCYPRSNIETYARIEDTGGIISEYVPGTPPLARQFPVRNRIISGLSDAVILVEAKEKSGSLITADQAIDQNRDVFVVPGRITDALSVGCIQYIRQGAEIITKPSDILECNVIKDLLAKKISAGNQIKSGFESINIMDNNDYLLKNSLASKKNMVYSVLNLYPKSLDTIIEETGLDVAEVNRILLELILSDRIEEVSKNCYIRMYM